MALTQITSNGIKDDEVKNADMADDSVGIAELSATGTASNTTYLRGDNTWTVPPDTDTTYTHPNHSGEVTSVGDGATTITDDVVDEANLKISNAGSDGQFLQKQSGNTGGLTWATPSYGGGGTGTDYDDNVKIRFGDDHDLEIYHSGSQSYISDVGTGALYITGSALLFMNADSTENRILCSTNDEVKLYYGGAEKLATTSTGILVTGNTKVGDAGKLIAGDGDDLQIYHNTNSFIQNSTGYLGIQSDTLYLQDKTNGHAYITCLVDGAVGIRYDNDEKLATNAQGVIVGGDVDNATGTQGVALQTGGKIRSRVANTSADAFIVSIDGSGASNVIINGAGNGLFNGGLDVPDDAKIQLGDGDDLQIYHSGTHSFIKDAGTGNLQIWTNQLSLLDSGGTESMIQAIENGAVELYHNGVKKFHTNAGGCQVFGNLTNGDSTHHFFGDSNDLDIYHDASDSWIQEDGGGNLHIASTGAGIMFFKGSSGSTEAMCRMYTDGAVELYHDNVKQFYTTSDGSRFVGQAEFDGGIRLTDTREIQFGDPAGGDFKIYHDGSHSYIDDAGTGALKIRTNELQLLNAAGDEYYLSGVENGAVSIYYDNSKKLSTTVNGVKLEGVNLWAPDDVKINIGQGDDLQLYHDGTHSWITNATGILVVETDQLDIRAINNEHYIEAELGGAVKLYYDDSEKIRTTSTGFKTIGNAQFDDSRKVEFGDGQDLQIFHDGSHSYIKSTHASAYIILSVNNGDAGIKILPNDAVELYYDDTRRLETTNGGITVTGSVTETSDETLKENIVTLTNAVDAIKQIKGVSFNWKDTVYGGKAIGVIAQDVEKVYPDLVFDREDKETKVTTKALNYAGLIGPLVECIKELDARIQTLEAA